MVRIDSLPDIQVEEEIKGIIRKAAENTLLMEKQALGSLRTRGSEQVQPGYECAPTDSTPSNTGNEDCEVSIFLTDDAEIHRLNKLYRNVDRPTDVLAFAMREGVDGELNQEILGDVVISLPRVKQQARVYGHSFEAEMSLLVSHGVLHLLGYEHEEKDDMLVMQRKQKDILHSLGFEVIRE